MVLGLDVKGSVLGNNVGELGELGEEMGELGEEVGELGEEVGGLGEGVGELGEGVGELGKEVGELGEEVDGLGEGVGGLGEEVGVILLLVLERESTSLVGEGGGGEAVAVDEDAMVVVKLRGTSVPVTDATDALEFGALVEDVEGGLLGGVTRPLLGELKEELVAMEELTVMKLEIEEVEERSSGDDAEVDDVKLRNLVSECWLTTHKTLTTKKS